MKKFFIYLFFIGLYFYPYQFNYAEKYYLTVELQHISLQDAIRHVAKFLNMNIIISSNIMGTTSLSFQHVDPKNAFDMLLMMHGLARWQMGNIWFVGTQAEFIKYQTEHLKWEEISLAILPLKTEVWPIRYGKAADILRILSEGQHTFLSKRGNAHIDERTNSICIQDVSDYLIRVKHLVHQLDIPIKQIMVEARLASVDNDFERELGINFSTEAPNSAENEKISKNWNSPSGTYSIAVAKLADGSLLDIKLAALENAGHAELISHPSLFTANQQTASIEAGEEVPYQEVSESGGTAIVFKKAVLGLQVTPQVLPNNKVLLQLQINQDRPSNHMVLGVPTISTRQIRTNILVQAGQTIVLGGIYESNKENGQKRIPFASELPVIGVLFKQQLLRQNKRQLLIFVTPKIMN